MFFPCLTFLDREGRKASAYLCYWYTLFFGRYTVFLTKATKDKMSETIDPWGDSYTEQVNEQSLREASIITAVDWPFNLCPNLFI